MQTCVRQRPALRTNSLSNSDLSNFARTVKSASFPAHKRKLGWSLWGTALASQFSNSRFWYRPLNNVKLTTQTNTHIKGGAVTVSLYTTNTLQPQHCEQVTNRSHYSGVFPFTELTFKFISNSSAATVGDGWVSVEHWWNDTGRGNWSTGRKTLYSVGGRWMNEYGALVEWYWQGKLEYCEKNLSVIDRTSSGCSEWFYICCYCGARGDRKFTALNTPRQIPLVLLVKVGWI
jgi:hypothetical protein